MKFFIDSAILREIENLYSAGICDGVTMNPSLLKVAVDEMNEQGGKESLESYIKKILKTAKGTPVSIEVTELNADAMVKQGKALYKKFNDVAGNVYIKVPVNPSFENENGKEFDGIKAIKQLSKAGIPINSTLIFTPEQALAAAKAGAAFVSPFCGRIDDMLRKEAGAEFKKTDYFPQEGIEGDSELMNDNGIVSGIDLVKQTVSIFRQHSIKTEVLAASMRNARQVREAALVGAGISTMGYETFTEIMNHPLTMSGMKKFDQDIPEEFRKIV